MSVQMEKEERKPMVQSNLNLNQIIYLEADAKFLNWNFYKIQSYRDQLEYQNNCFKKYNRKSSLFNLEKVNLWDADESKILWYLGKQNELQLYNNFQTELCHRMHWIKATDNHVQYNSYSNLLSWNQSIDSTCCN